MSTSKSGSGKARGGRAGKAAGGKRAATRRPAAPGNRPETPSAVAAVTRTDGKGLGGGTPAAPAHKADVVTRLRSARGRTTSQQKWLQRQLTDPYVKQARAAGWRARAAFKLIELDQQFQLLKGVRRVLDLGSAPGSWGQVVAEHRPGARIAAIDLLPMEPIAGVAFWQGDVRDAATMAQLQAYLEGPADLVLSDMAANTTGHKQTDHLRTMALVEIAIDAAEQALGPGGTFVSKVLAGGADNALLTRLKLLFSSVRHAKPPASRRDSSEWYVIAKGFKGSQRD